MPLDFPTSPAVGTYYNGYIWDGTVWDSALQPSVPALLTTAPVYANEAARTTAIPSPAEGQLSYLNDINQFQGYAGSSWSSLGGLVPITPTSIDRSGGSHTVSSLGAVTFSGVSAISLNGVFSSAYKNYRLIVTDIVGSVAGAQSLSIRFRVAGADNSTNNYYQYWTMKRLTGVIQDNTGGPSTSFALIGYDSSANNSYNWQGDINAPFATKNTTTPGLGYGTDATSSYTVTSTVLFNGATSFTGITFFPSANAVSGTVQIFGYNQ